jgi:hypothetical protein
MAQIIKFAAGVPEVVALKFDDGLEVDGRYGKQVSFATTDDRTFYVDPKPADDMLASLRHYGITKGTPFKLTKVTAGRWVVEPYQNGHRAPEPPPPAPPAPPQAPAAPPAAVAPAAPNTSTQRMMACFLVALDAVNEAQTYAKTKGIGITFSSDNVTSAALSCYINDCRNGGR